MTKNHCHQSSSFGPLHANVIVVLKCSQFNFCLLCNFFVSKIWNIYFWLFCVSIDFSHLKCFSSWQVLKTGFYLQNFPYLFQVVKNPVENGIEMVLDNIQQLRTVINRIRADPAQSTNPLTMKLNGTLDAAVNGGVSKFEVWQSNLLNLLLLSIYYNRCFLHKNIWNKIHSANL